MNIHGDPLIDRYVRPLIHHTHLTYPSMVVRFQENGRGMDYGPYKCRGILGGQNTPTWRPIRPVSVELHSIQWELEIHRPKSTDNGQSEIEHEI